MENGTKGLAARLQFALFAFVFVTGSLTACRVDSVGGDVPAELACSKDGVKNGAETDVDCGGACGATCKQGQTCVQDTDCDAMSPVCIAGRCAPLPAPSCSDGKQNNNETDVDCGGSCPKCGNGKACKADTDCMMGACVAGKCVPLVATCANGVRDNDETDIDCGGSCATKCDVGKVCVIGTDCVTQLCVNNICVNRAPDDTCVNGVKDGDETDVDCGGSCLPCHEGRGCNRSEDCLGRLCVNNVCGPDPIPGQDAGSDMLDGGVSSPVDLAQVPSPDLAQPPVPDLAVVPDLCQPPTPDLAQVPSPDLVVLPSCNDSVKNGAETDVDCGGGMGCAGCDTGKACKVALDCWHGVCTGDVCQAPTCNDGVENQIESDIDCGFSCGGNCPNGKKCAAGNDCSSSNCVNRICQPQPPNPPAPDLLILPDLLSSPDLAVVPDMSQPRDMANPAMDMRPPIGSGRLIVKASQASKNACNAGLIILVWNQKGQELRSAPGADLDVPIDNAWMGHAWMTTVCNGGYKADFVPLRGSMKIGGFDSVLYDGFEVAAFTNGLCQKALNVVQAAIPVEVHLRGKCPGDP